MTEVIQKFEVGTILVGHQLTIFDRALPSFTIKSANILC